MRLFYDVRPTLEARFSCLFGIAVADGPLYLDILQKLEIVRKLTSALPEFLLEQQQGPHQSFAAFRQAVKSSR
jgi:hypothetical protein